MNIDNLLPLPMGVVVVAWRHLAARAVRLAAASRPCLPCGCCATVLAATAAASLVNLMNWNVGDARMLVAVGLASLVATTALAAGWLSEPDELERWSLRAVAAACASAWPILVS